MFPAKEYERTRTEVLIETFIRKQLRLKGHTVTKVEETEEHMLVYIDRLGKRLLRCGVCRQRCMLRSHLDGVLAWTKMGHRRGRYCREQRGLLPKSLNRRIRSGDVAEDVRYEFGLPLLEREVFPANEF